MNRRFVGSIFGTVVPKLLFELTDTIDWTPFSNSEPKDVDLYIIDLSTNLAHGIAVGRRLTFRSDSNVLLLVDAYAASHIALLRPVGARGMINKSSSSSAMKLAITQVARGCGFLDAEFGQSYFLENNVIQVKSC